MLQRWYPIHNFRRFEQAADRFTQVIPSRVRVNADRSWAVPLDVVEDDGHIVVKASLPGLQVDDIDVTIEGGILTITADTKVPELKNDEGREDGGYVVRERRSGSFHRSLRLPEHVDTDKVEPRYENGVLTITLPVAESKKAKHLKIAVGAALPEGK